MARGHPTTRVILFCIGTFFAGRFLQLPGLPDAGRGVRQLLLLYPRLTPNARVSRLLPTYSPSSTPQLTVHRGRKALLEVPDAAAVAAASRPPSAAASRVLSGDFSTFEELLDASGMLSDRPPVPAGVSGHPMYTMQPMQLLSWYPRAYLFPRFMDLARCEHVIALAERRLAPSGLALKQGDTLSSTREIRTSQGTFLGRSDDPGGVLGWIEDKLGA